MAANPKEILEKLLDLLGFNDATVEETQVEDGTLYNIACEDVGRLIGRQGQTLSYLQYLLNRLLIRYDQDAPKVLVDVGGYRSQVKLNLVKKAKDAAEKVRRWGDVVELEPMNAFDRWVVHNALKEDDSIETNSVEVAGSDQKAIILRPKH